MPPQAYTRLLTERQLARWYQKPSSAERPHVAQQQAIWQRVRDWGDQSGLTDARLALDDLEGEQTYRDEERLLLIVGTLCMRNGQRSLWSSIYNTIHGGAGSAHGDEFDYLEDVTARARAGLL